MSDFNQSPSPKDQLDLVYGLNERPKPLIAFLAAFQHLLAIIVPIVTPGLLICLALGVSKQDTNMILSMSLVISGFATFYNVKKSALLVLVCSLCKAPVLTLLARLLVLALPWSPQAHRLNRSWRQFLVL